MLTAVGAGVTGSSHGRSGARFPHVQALSLLPELAEGEIAPQPGQPLGPAGAWWHGVS